MSPVLGYCIIAVSMSMRVCRAAYRKRHAEYEAESQRYEEARAAVESENKALREAYDAYLLNEQAIAQDSKRCPHCSRVVCAPCLAPPFNSDCSLTVFRRFNA